MKRLTVLIPVYSNQSGLDRSLESLRAAEGSFSVVVVDDGSREELTAPARLRDDVPVSLLRIGRNTGIAAALNLGLEFILAGESDYVGRLDAGDTVAEDRFTKQIAYMEENPEHAVVASFVDFVDGAGRLLFRFRAPCDHARIVRRMRINSCLIHPGTMLRTSALRQVGIYREDVPIAEDYELFLRLGTQYKLGVIPEVLTWCEYSQQGISVEGRRRQQVQRLKLQLRYFDARSPYSFYGVVRTLIAMITPERMVLRFKQAYLR